MQLINQLANNRILWIAIFAWAISCVIKGIVCIITSKTLKMNKIFGSGGMPSTHSATVSALAVITGIEQGFDSPFFAIALILAIVVMYDASGIRRAAGQHASFINILMDGFRKDGSEEMVKLKEVLGHTPLEVTAGATLGIIVAIVCSLYI